MADDLEVARRVRLLKVSAGLRDVDVARALSMSRAAVQARMTARTSWKPPELAAVAQLLGTTVAKLFGESIGPAVAMLEVRDVVSLSGWYSERLGVRVRELRAPRYAELESELGSRFMLYLGVPLPDPEGLTLYLQVRDVGAAYDAARARASPSSVRHRTGAGEDDGQRCGIRLAMPCCSWRSIRRSEGKGVADRVAGRHCSRSPGLLHRGAIELNAE